MKKMTYSLILIILISLNTVAQKKVEPEVPSAGKQGEEITIQVGGPYWSSWDPAPTNKPEVIELFYAIIANNIEKVQDLLSSKKVNINVIEDRTKWTPLHLAVDLLSVKGIGDTQMIKLLLSYNPNLETKDYSGKTPLETAVSEGRMDIVKLLIEHGAHYFYKDYLNTMLLSIAVKLGLSLKLVLPIFLLLALLLLKFLIMWLCLAIVYRNKIQSGSPLVKISTTSTLATLLLAVPLGLVLSLIFAIIFDRFRLYEFFSYYTSKESILFIGLIVSFIAAGFIVDMIVIPKKLRKYGLPTENGLSWWLLIANALCILLIYWLFIYLRLGL